MSKLLTDEQHQFLLNNYIGLDNKELTERINKQFNSNFTVQQIKGYKHNRHLDSGLTGRFEKGHIPSNKGKTWDDFMSEQSKKNSLKTCFKKGNTPKNSDPVGTEKWKSSHKNRADEGFLYVKVQDKKGRFNWKQKHRLIWEEHYGSIPKGYKVIFKDGNRHNFELDNLALVSNSQMLILNRNNLIYSDKHVTESSIILSKYIDRMNKKVKSYKEQKNVKNKKEKIKCGEYDER